MIANVTKWGNSLALRIPQHLAKEIELIAGGEVEILVVDGNLVVKPKKQRQYSLDDLIAGITPANLHGEIDSGISVGVEVW